MASIRQRGSTWTVMWREDGKQRGKTYRSERDANLARAQIEAGHAPLGRPVEVQHAKVRGRLTVAGYAPTFLAEHAYSDSGLSFAKLALDLYLIPKFGSRSMVSITPADVRSWFRQLELVKSGALIRKIRSVASSMWKDAIEAEVVTSNPWLGQRIKSHPGRAKRILTPAEYQELLETITPHYRLLVRTLGETGLRWSEAMRLTPRDVRGSVIHVARSKSGKPRDIRVSADLADELRRGLPFVNSAGTALNYMTFRTGHWIPATRGMDVTIHDLRHSHASWLLQGGADLVTVRDRLGHSSIAITSGYLHTLPDAGDKALNALDTILGGH